MTDMTLVLRIKADGTAEVVGAAKQVAAAVADVGSAGAEAGRIAKAATDEAALAQAKLARLVQETATPVERLKAALAELETLAPFAGTAEQARALARATDELDRSIASHSDEVRTAAAAQERLADLVDKTRTPVERLQATLAELERLRPFATSADEADALSRAVAAAETALVSHSEATRQAASAQARLAALIDESRTPVERLQSRLAELAALHPFVTSTEEADALSRAVASTEAALEGQSAATRDAAAAQSRLAALMVETATPVERLRARLDELRALRPFAQSIPEAQALGRAIEATETEIARSTDAARTAAAAQGQLAQIIGQTKTEAEKLEAELRRLEALRPFAHTGEETMALERALARVRAEIAGVNAAQNGMAQSSRLAAHEITNLSFQAQDFIVQVGSGQGIFRPLLQQGPQAVMAVGGLSRAMALLLTPTSLVAAGFGAVALAGATVLARASAISTEVRALDVSLRALNPNLNATGTALRSMAQDIASDRGVTRQDATAAVRTIALNPRINDAALVRSLAALAQDVQAVLGGSVEQVAAKLADAFAGGAAGVRKLDDELGFLWVEEAKSVALMGRHGDQAGVLATAMNALQRHFGSAAKRMQSDGQDAFRELGREWDNLVEKLASSDLAQAVAHGLGQALKGMSWWVAGVPAEMQKAIDLSETSALLDRTQNDLTRKVEAGDGDGAAAKLLRQQLQTLQQRYYELQRQSGPAGGRTTAPPLTRSANDITPEVGQSAANQKWLNDERQAYEDLSGAMKGTAAQRVLNRAELEANREADRRNMDDTARMGLVETRRKEALLEMTAAESDRSSAVDRAISLNTQYTQELLRFTPSAADAVEHTIRYKAAMEAQAAAASNAAVSVEAMTSQLVLQAAAQSAADGAKTVSDLQARVEWEEKIADAARDGAGAQAEAERQAESAVQTSALLGAAQAAEAEGAAELGQLLRELAADYETLSKRSDEARKRRQGEESLRSARAELELTQTELSLMGRAEPYRDRALRSLQIQQQAAQMAKSATTEQIVEWVRLQEQIADTQALVNFQKEVQATAKEISQSISESLYDRLMDPSKATSVVDVFRSIFKRIAVAALETQVVLPIVTQVVGSAPGLFGIQSPSGTAANQNGGLLSGNTGQTLQAGQSLYSGLTGGTSSTMTGIGDWLATSQAGQGLGLSAVNQSAVGAIGPQIPGAVTMTPAGTSFSSVLGGIGAAAPYGFLGGMGGAYLSNRFMGGSKVGGALSGAALGVGTYAAGTAAMGAMGMGAAASAAGVSGMAGATAALSAIPVYGWVAAAVLAAITAIAGTQKPTVGPTASADITINAGGKSASAGNFLVDNDGNIKDAEGIGTAFSAIFSAAAAGGGTLAKNFGVGRTAAKGLYVAGSVPYREFGTGDDALGNVLRYTLLEAGGLQGGGANVTKAIQRTKATTYEDAAKDIALGSAIDAGTTALAALDKSLNSFTVSAKAATTESMKPMLDELARAKGLDLGSEYVKLATDQLNAYLDQLRNPPSFTQTEQDMASLSGQFAALREAYQQLNPALAGTVDAIEKETRARIQASVQNDANRQLNSALGRDYVNQINELALARDINARNLTAVGLSTQRAAEIYDASLRTLLDGLDASQLDVVATLFSGGVHDLAVSMRDAARATEQATAAQAAAQAEAQATQAAAQAVADALTQSRSARDAQADLTARARELMGDSNGAALVRSDLSAAREREQAANNNFGMLGLIQAAERASTIANALRQDLLTAIDRQVQAVNTNTSTLQATAQKWGQLSGLATAASSSLTTGDSYLPPWERLTAARSQWQAALDTWNSSTATEDERFAAAGQLQTLGQALKEAATGWFGGTSNADARNVDAVWAQIGQEAQRQVSAAEAQIKVNEAQLRSLEAARTSAEALGARQIAGIDTLTTQTGAAFAALTTAVNAVSAALGSSVTATVQPVLSAEQTYLRDNPDVARDAYYSAHVAEHYALNGAREGRAREGLTLTRDQEYLARYADVAAAVARGEFTNGEDHYNRYGRFEGRTFATGGVMTPWGELEPQRRSAGGVATQPTLAVYGEGDRPEAFVPLPDGRTIPVTVSLPRPTAPTLSAGSGSGMERLAALIARNNDLTGAVLTELGRNTRATAAAGAETVMEARAARALASRQAAVAERLGRKAA